MALDDPVVITLIIMAAVLLFGGAKIPEFARSLGRARREFTRAVNGLPEEKYSSN